MADSDIQGYKCKACGGPLEFRGDLNKMFCKYCDSEYDLSEFEQEQEGSNAALTAWDQKDWTQIQPGTKGMKEYNCTSCGADLVTDENTGATECPYCGSPVIVKDTFEGMFLPDGVIPFKVDKTAAQEALKNFYKGKKLLPKNFTDSNRIDNINGMYVPFWLFDCTVEGEGRYEGKRKVGEFRRTERVGNEDRTVTYEEFEFFDVFREGSMQFEKIPADASKEMNDAYMDSLEPYDFSAVVPYNSAYFSGYLANKYDETQEEVRDRVEKRVDSTMKLELSKTVTGYDSVSTQKANTRITDSKVHYVMLPVWMLSTKYNNEIYSFAMNGQSGTVTGNLPVDSKRATGLLLKTAGIAMVIIEIFLAILEYNSEILPHIIALVVSLFIGFAVLNNEKHKMVTHQASNAANYIVKDSFSLRRRYDSFSHKKTERKG